MSLGRLDAGLATWGISEIVQEPPTGSAERRPGPGVKLDASIVGTLNTGERPSPRDWSVSMLAANLSEFVLIEAPRVVAEVRYGTGAGEYVYTAEIPVVGVVWHVCALWISIRTYVLAPIVVPSQRVRLDLSVVPGTPLRQTVSERYPYGDLNNGNAARIDAPRFARRVSLVTVEYAGGSPVNVTDGIGRFVYRGINGIAVASPNVPLTLATTPTPTFRAVHTSGVFLPSSGDALGVPNVGAGGFHHVEWEVQS